jgi:AcrR family transcriptional regulator
VSTTRRTVDEDAILDATLRSVMAIGIRRTTMSDVARQAGVSRVTVYRRFDDLAALMAALMSREFGAVLATAQEQATREADGRSRLVALAVHGAELLCEHPLLHRILDVDPEIVLPYVTVRAGHFQQAVIEIYAQELRAGIEDGSIAPGDPGAMAAAIELAQRGLVLSARSRRTAKERATATAELRRMLEGYLRP